MTPVTFGQLAELMNIIRGVGFVQYIADKTLSITTTCVGIAGFTVLMWDHVDTFTSEVEYIWLGEKSYLVYLFLINRYLTPLGFIINLYGPLYCVSAQGGILTNNIAYLSPVWNDMMYHDSYQHVQTLCSIRGRYDSDRNWDCRVDDAHTVRDCASLPLTSERLLSGYSIYTLYNKRKYIVIGLATLFVLQVGIHAWLLTKGIPVHHVNENVHSCTMIFEARNTSERVLTSATAWLPLIYDTAVFLLTLYKTLPSIRKASLSRELMKQLLEDGVIYYGVILAVALALTIMMIAADDGVKNVAAQLQLLLSVNPKMWSLPFEYLIAQVFPPQVTMMSRITLNLKKSRERLNSPAKVAQLLGVEMTPLQDRKSSSTYRRNSDDVEALIRHASHHTLPPSAHLWRH
ncbi:hypothetical protein L218DRAFT_997820 [Marasmius fiardii PR-910]|nr:hypothetical protein L218DRAFT_997820 [Marasmius fiardii PR-910]